MKNLSLFALFFCSFAFAQENQNTPKDKVEYFKDTELSAEYLSRHSKTNGMNAQALELTIRSAIINIPKDKYTHSVSGYQFLPIEIIFDTNVRSNDPKQIRLLTAALAGVLFEDWFYEEGGNLKGELNTLKFEHRRFGDYKNPVAINTLSLINLKISGAANPQTNNIAVYASFDIDLVGFSNAAEKFIDIKEIKNQCPSCIFNNRVGYNFNGFSKLEFVVGAHIFNLIAAEAFYLTNGHGLDGFDNQNPKSPDDLGTSYSFGTDYEIVGGRINIDLSKIFKKTNKAGKIGLIGSFSVSKSNASYTGKSQEVYRYGNSVEQFYDNRISMYYPLSYQDEKIKRATIGITWRPPAKKK